LLANIGRVTTKPITSTQYKKLIAAARNAHATERFPQALGAQGPDMLNQSDPEFWHSRAEEVRACAEMLHDLDARRVMLQIAMMYSGMALRIELRLAERQAAT
jgi:hypothetical protein